MCQGSVPHYFFFSFSSLFSWYAQTPPYLWFECNFSFFLFFSSRYAQTPPYLWFECTKPATAFASLPDGQKTLDAVCVSMCVWGGGGGAIRFSVIVFEEIDP